MKENKIGLVILNFLTYKDTLESIISLSNNIEINCNLIVYVVDNNSNKSMLENLKQELLAKNLNFNIMYLKSDENIGFARGMNLGIKKALNDGCNYVICSNNDIFYKKKIYFNHIIDVHQKDKSIAVIGPKILDPDNINQNPYMTQNRSKNNFFKKIRQKLVFTNFIGKLIFFLIGYKDYFFKYEKNHKNINSQTVYCLHGSFFILTPAYFKYYSDLDPNTFLYNEELILAERVKQKNLLMYYTTDLEVFHKDDSSTNEMLGKNSFKKLNFILNENYKSRSYFLREYIW